MKNDFLQLTNVSKWGRMCEVCASVRVVERWVVRTGRGVGVDSCNMYITWLNNQSHRKNVLLL